MPGVRTEQRRSPISSVPATRRGCRLLRRLVQRLEKQGHVRGLTVLYPIMARLYLSAGGRYVEVLTAADRAIALARAVGDDRLWAAAVLWRRGALQKVGRVEEALRAVAEAIPLAETAGDLYTLSIALMVLSCQY